ncbi:MAG: hypothetical protein ACLP4W_13040 [Mycobacterium sp.]|uniref:hypothetical protein n=1 Tax=Mycobacterium sp. TaxID=1785 RepID=UPI003F992FEB
MIPYLVVDFGKYRRQRLCESAYRVHYFVATRTRYQDMRHVSANINAVAHGIFYGRADRPGKRRSSMHVYGAPPIGFMCTGSDKT